MTVYIPTKALHRLLPNATIPFNSVLPNVAQKTTKSYTYTDSDCCYDNIFLLHLLYFHLHLQRKS
jgi:hypothetical protein